MWEQESYQLSANAAGSLGFPLWSASTDDRVSIILFGVSRYADVNTSDHTYRYGVAVRVLIEILDVNGTAKMSLSSDSSPGRTQRLASQFAPDGVGLRRQHKRRLAGLAGLRRQSYSEYFAAITGLQKTIFDDAANMRPHAVGSTLAGTIVNATTDIADIEPEGSLKTRRTFHYFRPFGRRAAQGDETQSGDSTSATCPAHGLSKIAFGVQVRFPCSVWWSGVRHLNDLQVHRRPPPRQRLGVSRKAMTSRTVRATRRTSRMGGDCSPPA